MKLAANIQKVSSLDMCCGSPHLQQNQTGGPGGIRPASFRKGKVWWSKSLPYRAACCWQDLFCISCRTRGRDNALWVLLVCEPLDESWALRPSAACPACRAWQVSCWKSTKLQCPSLTSSQGSWHCSEMQWQTLALDLLQLWGFCCLARLGERSM